MSRLFATLLALGLATSTQSDPNPQLIASVEHRLAAYGLHADVSQLATSTVARLHLTLSQRDSYLRKRRELISILRNPKYK